MSKHKIEMDIHNYTEQHVNKQQISESEPVHFRFKGTQYLYEKLIIKFPVYSDSSIRLLINSGFDGDMIGHIHFYFNLRFTGC